MTMNQRNTIDLEQGWDFMQKGITKLKNILEGLPEPQFSSEDYMMLYTTIYNMCTQKPPHDYSQQLYDKYRESFEEYITTTVLPSLREKHDEFMLRELVKRWLNHKIMVRWLSRFFHYLDRYFVALPALKEVGLTCFRDLVYMELFGKVRDAVISLIDQEREGEQIDRALLKNVLDIFVEIGMGQMDHYENDFEEAMLKDTAAYYSRKASNWILEDSCPDYMLKAEECLKREKDRVSHYLHSSSESKLLEIVQHELLSVYATQLLEKEHSGCHALLRDDKVEDLSRMYRLFSKIPRGLEPVAHIFKQHVTAEGTALVKQAEDAASTKKMLTVMDSFSPMMDVKLLRFGGIGDPIELLGLFKIFPKLERLVIDWKLEYGEVINLENLLHELDMGEEFCFYYTCLKPESLANMLKPFLMQLKTVEISWYFYEASIFEFVEIILKHAAMIEKIVIQKRGNKVINSEDMFVAAQKMVSLQRSFPTVEMFLSSNHIV